MKTVYLVRHAKSSWENPELTDHDRPLNERGLKSIEIIGEKLKALNIKPQLIIASSATRASETARLIAPYISYPVEKLVISEKIYLAGVHTLLKFIGSQNDDIQHLMIVGHNPDFSDLANLLTNLQVAELPTCAIVGIEFNISSWNKISQQKGKMLFFEYPKNNF